MKKRENVYLYMGIFILMSVIMVFICRILHVAPFGPNTFATKDGDIQYLDFYAYLKDVLSGNQSISYTFGKTLGGNNIAVFGYYLSSPLNWIVIFFEKSQLEIFYTVIVSLKLSLAAVTCAIFLKNRYPLLQDNIIIVLAISYGLMQYNMAQICNAMWLDGVIMLPLVLLGVYHLVQDEKKITLMLAVGFSILFNWYTGAINCLFSVIWLIYEVLRVTEISRMNVKQIWRYIWQYCYAMVTGVLLSCVLFVPVVCAMFGGRAGIDFSALKEHYYWGNCFSFISRMVIGSNSEYASVSLYCGSTPVIGTIAYLLTKSPDKRKKGCNIFLLLVTISLFYVPVFILLFGLLKDVSSYWYRYSYVGIISLVAIASEFFSNDLQMEERKRVLFQAWGMFAVILLTMEYVKTVNNIVYVYVTIVAAGLFALLYFIKANARRKKLLLSGILVIAVAGELIYNAKVLNCVVEHADDYCNYVEQEEKMIAGLKNYDTNFYRVNQTKTRNEESNNLTANYNESLAFQYNSVSGYTSDPDDIQRDFLDKLGYNICGDNMNIVNTSIIGADSLMNVKYILADYEINGLKKLEKLDAGNGKNIYQNPFVLPFAFTYPDSVISINEKEKNPFLYQNEIYSKLLGRNIELYKKLNYERVDENNSVSFYLRLPEKESAVYGYCDMTEWGSGDIYANNEYLCGYNQWLAPRVVYIPSSPDMKSIEVRIDKENAGQCIEDSQFYYLDLNELSAVTQEINQRQAHKVSVENGKVVLETSQSKEGEKLYVAMPYENGWEILQNGKKLKPDLVGGCMISIPLKEGNNRLEMEYHAPGIWIGRIFTMIGVCIVLYEFGRGRRMKNE